MNQKLLRKFYLACGVALPLSGILLTIWIHVYPEAHFWHIAPIPLWMTIGLGVAFVICLPWYVRFVKGITETKLEFWGRLIIEVGVIIMVLIGLSLG